MASVVHPFTLDEVFEMAVASATRECGCRDGQCYVCEGSKVAPSWLVATGRATDDGPCPECTGTGVCPDCKGTKVNVPAPDSTVVAGNVALSVLARMVIARRFDDYATINDCLDWAETFMAKVMDLGSIMESSIAEAPAFAEQVQNGRRLLEGLQAPPANPSTNTNTNALSAAELEELGLSDDD